MVNGFAWPGNAHRAALGGPTIQHVSEFTNSKFSYKTAPILGKIKQVEVRLA